MTWNASREAEATAGATRLRNAQRRTLSLTLLSVRAFGSAVWFFSPWTSRVHQFNATRRYPHQYWVWAAMESPSNWHHSANASAGLLPVRFWRS